MRVIGQREIQIRGGKEDADCYLRIGREEDSLCIGNLFDDVETGVLMYGGCIEDVCSKEGVVPYLRLWSANTIGRSGSVQ